MHGAHRAVIALTHRVQHRDDLVAADLADDDPIRVHAQTHSHQFRCGHLPCALDVRLASLECDAVGMDIGEAVQAELELGLDRHDALARRDLRGERPQHGGLPRTGRSGDDQLLSCSHRSGEERGQTLVDRSEPDEVGQRQLHEAVPTDRDRWAVTDPCNGEQP